MAPKRRQPVGRPRGKSGLPAPIPGEPFSLLGTLRRCTQMLTVKDVAQLLTVPEKTVYKYLNTGVIPCADLGFDIKRVDPKAWAHLLEHDNPHLKPSARSYQAA